MLSKRQQRQRGQMLRRVLPDIRRLDVHNVERIVQERLIYLAHCRDILTANSDTFENHIAGDLYFNQPEIVAAWRTIRCNAEFREKAFKRIAQAEAHYGNAIHITLARARRRAAKKARKKCAQSS